jgi:hypothetical protein
MTEPPTRRRRETADAVFGVGGLAPHPARGPVTALRVLGAGFEIAADPSRAQQAWATVGDRLTVKGMLVLALDELTRQLIEPLTAHFGVGAHDDVDSVLTAVLWKRPLILHASRCEDVFELAHVIHEHANRKGFPFTQIDALPSCDAQIEELCVKAGCGTILLDLTEPFDLPQALVRCLFSEHFHLWTIAVARAEKDVYRCFGPGMEFAPFSRAGFRRMGWHSAMHDVTFTKR